MTPHVRAARSFRRTVAGAISVLLATLLVAGCSGADFGGKDDNGGKPKTKQSKKGAAGVFKENTTMYRIQKSGKIRVGVTFSVPPYASRNAITGSPEGFDIEVVELIATGIFGSQIDGKIEYFEINPRERELALDQGKVDIVVGRYDITPAKKNFVDFAGPSLISHQVVIAPDTRSSSTIVNSLLDLNGKKACVVRGSTNTDALKAAAPQVDMSTVQNTVDECGAQLAVGAVVAVVADAIDSRSYLTHGGKSLRVVTAGFGQVAYGVGIKKDVVDMRQYINNQLDGWEEWRDSTTKWLSGTPGELDQPAVERY